MKTITSSGTKDFTIEEYQYAIKDNKGKFIYTDEASHVGKHKGRVKSITFFEMLSDDIQKEIYVRVELNAGQIKELYKKIIEIEAKESEEFIDE